MNQVWLKIGAAAAIASIGVGCPAPEPAPSPSPASTASAAPKPQPSTASPTESPVTAYSPPPHTPRKETGPGMSEGQLSAEFSEVEVKVSASFAHDAGMQSSLESLSVSGEPCDSHEVLQRLVALRGGWTVSGGSSDEEVKATLKAFVEAWGAIFPHSGRLTGDSLPSHLERHVGGGPVAAGDPSASYHPPRVGIYALDDGDKLAVHSFFRTWDGGNHGQQLAYEVEAYKVSDGSFYSLREPKSGLGKAPEKTGPQPVDPKIPRPRDLTGF